MSVSSRLCPAVVFPFLWLALLPAAAQAPKTAAPAPPAGTKSAAPPAGQTALPGANSTVLRQSELDAILAGDEPGAQLRALQAFLIKYPGAPEAESVYRAMIHDATLLADSPKVLEYNIKLQQLDPADIGQRITTLNLLLLETDPDSRALAVQFAHNLDLAVQAKAHDPITPDEVVSPGVYQADMSRLRALAALFEGSAAQAVGQYADAETYLVASLRYAQSEEAAEHLATVYVAEDKLPQALDAYTLALALPGDTVAQRAALLAQAEDLYQRLYPDHASASQHASLGDRILAQFQAVAARDADEQKALASDPTGRNQNARSAMDFSFSALDGSNPRLGDSAARHQVVVVCVWSVETGLAPAFADLRRQFESYHDVIFITVNEDPAATPDPLDLWRQSHPELGPAADTWRDSGLAGYLSLDSLPAVLVFDRGGTMVYRREGLTPGSMPPHFAAELGGVITQAIEGTLP